MTPAKTQIPRQVVGWHQYEAIGVSKNLGRLLRLELVCRVSLPRCLK